jgi:hypothetical protein
LLYLLQDKKETLQMLAIFALVASLVYLICDYLLVSDVSVCETNRGT